MKNSIKSMFVGMVLAILGGVSLTAKAEEAAETTKASTPAIGFFKLVVVDPDKMQAFYENTFGFKMANKYVFPGIDERVMRLPGSPVSLVLFHYTDGRKITVGNGHGPVGIVTDDVDGYYEKALAEGATSLRAPADLGATGTRLAFVLDPEGHQIELIRLGQ